MRYFKCIEWVGTSFTEGKIYPSVDGIVVTNNYKKADISSPWMMAKFIEVYTFHDYLKEVEKP